MTWTEEQRAAHKYTREQRAEYQRSWRSRNLERAHANDRAYRAKTAVKRRAYKLKVYGQMRAILWSAKSGPCIDCGHRYPPCVMDFDHRDPTTKVRQAGRWAAYQNVPNLLAEIAKCDLVCANCHRIRTFRSRNSASAVAQAAG